MKTANILLIIFAFIAIGLYTKYIKAMIHYRMGRTPQQVIVPAQPIAHHPFNSDKQN